MIKDRFDELKTVPFDELVQNAYEEYLEHFNPEDGEPMNYGEFEDYWWRF